MLGRPQMRPRHLLMVPFVVFSALALPRAARADDPPAPAASAASAAPVAPAASAAPGAPADAAAPGTPATPPVPRDLSRLVLETGRPEVLPPERDLVRLQINGEYQLRYEHLRSFPLDPSVSLLATQPRAREDSLGQNDFLLHWLRITPRLQLKDKIAVIAQLDLLTGQVAGETAHDTHADEEPRDDYDGFKNVQPRWLYLEATTKIGLFRVGQQPSHWGMGIVANDGDHPSLFGDYRYGAIVERFLYATKPAGKDSQLVVAIAGDLVYRDQLARLSRGDQALEGVLAVLWDAEPNQLGFYGVYRHQTNDKTSGSEFFTYTDSLDLGILDVAGKFAAPVAGAPEAYVFGQAEAALALGSTNEIRSLDQARSGDRTAIRAYGGAVDLGVVHRRAGPHTGIVGRAGQATVDKPDPVTWGDLVAQVEIGYASGDADPYDDTEHRFSFSPNHKVGLLLFDEVLRFQTARAATAAQDPLLSNATRPTPGVDLLPSNGGVFGAEYVNPTVVVRPRRWLDLKGGMVIAQTTSDVVDPYRLATKGAYTNYRGGDPKRHDLGVELDAGFEGRAPLEYGLVLSLGAQGGVLFPGGALADADGNRMKVPWIVVGRGGLLF